jgi:Holliday junction resolvase RusA-like endonuclease
MRNPQVCLFFILFSLFVIAHPFALFSNRFVFSSLLVKPVVRRCSSYGYPIHMKKKNVNIDDIDIVNDNLSLESSSTPNHNNGKRYRAIKAQSDINSSFNENIVTFIEQLPSSDGGLTFTVYGEPTPLSRHRVARGRMYNPSAQHQREFARACEACMPSKPLDGPLAAHLTFYFQRPKSHYRTGKYKHVLKPTAPSRHCTKKDLDNLVKFVLDALNGRAYIDDCQIAVIHAYKYFTNTFQPRIDIALRKFDDI